MKRLAGVFISIFLLSSFLTACHEGPAEKQGKQIDKSVESVKDQLQNKGPAQKAGEKVDEVSGNS